MEGVELHSIRIYLNEQRMDVMVLDGSKPRVIDYRWQTRGMCPVPPSHWWTAVCGEIEWLRTQDAKKASGTWLPSM